MLLPVTVEPGDGCGLKSQGVCERTAIRLEGGPWNSAADMIGRLLPFVITLPVVNCPTSTSFGRNCPNGSVYTRTGLAQFSTSTRVWVNGGHTPLQIPRLLASSASLSETFPLIFV